jgi:competence protein ComEC
MPIGIVIFGQVNPAGYLANIVAIPLVSFIVLPLILAAMLMAICGIDWSRWLFQLADALLGLLTDYLGLLLDSGLASISSASLPLAMVFLLLAGILLLLMPRGTPARSLAFALLLVPLIWQAPRLEQAEYQVTVFDVGMGTSLMLQTRHHSLVYDFGPGNERGFSAADWGLLPLMKKTAIDMPDLLIVSHVDQDHSGGFRSFLGNYQPGRLVSGTPAELAARFRLGHRVRSCHHYPGWRWDGVSFRFLSVASSGAQGSTNNRSCVLQISGHQRTLIAGDIEAEQEAKLVRSLGDDLEADVLLAPHHGSSTSSSEQFVGRVKPSYVIFTVAAGNRWGFPRASVISRYQAIAAIQYRSDIDGAISLRSTATGLRVKLSRKPGHRIWRHR